MIGSSLSLSGFLQLFLQIADMMGDPRFSAVPVLFGLLHSPFLGTTIMFFTPFFSTLPMMRNMFLGFIPPSVEPSPLGDNLRELIVVRE